MKGINAGEKNFNWKGDKVGKQAIHSWLIRHYGKPDKCEICGIFGKYIFFNRLGKPCKMWTIAYAKIKGKEYERKRENFWCLCHKCHMPYDDVGKKSALKNKGRIPWAKGKHWKVKDNSNMKGRTPWNKGLLGFRKGHPNYNTKPNKTSFKKGIIPWNKGLKGFHSSSITKFQKGKTPKKRKKIC